MAILPVTPDDVEVITTTINPTRYYVTSSLGLTGSLQLFPRSSDIEKEIRPLGNFESSVVADDDVESHREELATVVTNTRRTTSGSFYFSMLDFLDNKVNKQSTSARKKKTINILRFTPGVSMKSNMLRKLNVKDILMKYYSIRYPSARWGYTNYNTLNFFTAPTVPTSSVLLYPCVERTDIDSNPGYVTGSYGLSGSFSFDFYINPRNKTDGTSGFDFKAGTIFHLSSSYCLSLITGSHKDINGYNDTFRLQLQLSHSADISPSKAAPGSYPNDLIFLSDDNSLDWNKWQRVVVRWGTTAINEGTGSFVVDGVEKGTFVVPSGTIMPKIYDNNPLFQSNPDVLCLGNYYEGNNTGIRSFNLFFSNIPAEREGLENLIDDGGLYDQPLEYAFNHPLNAELHNITIKRYYVTDQEIAADLENPTNLSRIDPKKIAFYVPPFFVEKTPVRRHVDFFGGKSYGGILQTPFYEIDGSTDDPFNVAMSFGVGGHYINLENFVKDLANDNWPRLHHLSASIIDYTTTARQADEFLYDDPRVVKRNLTVLPCDNGNFIPNYSLIEGDITNRQYDNLGRFDPSFINLDNLLNPPTILGESDGVTSGSLDLTATLLGYSPENPGLPPGSAVLGAAPDFSAYTDKYGPGTTRNIPMTVYERTKDPSSNQVTLFDISNLFFGNRIIPGTFVVADGAFTGSAGRVSITLKDDGYGNIYRADSLTTHDKKNSVGNIFYNEGIVIIKSPHLYHFGKEGYEMSFTGEQNLHTQKYSVLAPASMINSSSNPSYIAVQDDIKASTDPTDTESFVYISGINFHDDNLNVVAKASLAQPIIKREGDKILFRVSIDW